MLKDFLYYSNKQQQTIKLLPLFSLLTLLSRVIQPCSGQTLTRSNAINTQQHASATCRIAISRSFFIQKIYSNKLTFSFIGEVKHDS